MAQNTHQFDFLIEYVLALLEENKISLTDEQKKIYVPQILAQVELRLGLELLPKLTAPQKEKFVKLANNVNTTPGEWKIFWHSAVPSFEEEVKGVLIAFAEKIKQILAK
jgi:hypothetical protein